MTAVVIDSSVLLDVMTEDSNWFEWSSGALARIADDSRLIINAVIYAEASVRFSRIEEFEATLSGTPIEREHIPFEAAFLAGKIFLAYRRRGGTRSLPLPGFFIGAHAAVAGHRLLTRDPARFRTYFPRLRLIAPD
jgi:predicted nucleic acid-binding protein